MAPPFRTRVVSGLAAGGLALAGAIVVSAPAAAAPNEAPDIIPTLQQWQGGEGHFALSSTSQIVTESAGAQTAETLADDLSELVGLTLDVAVDADPGAGDIELVLEPEMTRPDVGEQFADEGYELDITDSAVTLTAPTTTGLYYGTRTMLQALLQSSGRTQLPVGTTIDWPDYATRGFSLDVGRRFFEPEFIRDYITMMSWYKLNTFQIHLNDNEITAPGGDWSKAYQAFRLKSDDPTFDGLVAEDGSYDRQDWQSFEDTAAERGLTILPEIDVPAHSRAFVQWKPELGLNDGNSDNLDLSKPETTEIIQSVFEEFIPWFEGPAVHFGADEYPGDKELYKHFFNDMAEFVRDQGKQPYAWGSLTHMGGADGYDKDVIISSWNVGYYGMAAAKADGFKFLNINDASLYVVPFADYYHPNGLNNPWLYTDWLPNDQGEASVDPGDPEGGMFAVWNDKVDLDYSALDMHGLVWDTFPVIATKTWRAEAPETSYADFTGVVSQVGSGPGLHVIDQDGTAAPGSLSFEAPVTASSTSEGYDPAAITDGNDLTRWETDADQADVTIDLGEAVQTGRIDVDWSGDAPESYDVLVSTDGVFWQYAATDVPGSQASVQLENLSARYVRLADITTGGEAIGLWSADVFSPAPLNIGATATSSGDEASATPASAAIDGNPSTRWAASYDDPSWLAIDFGEPVTFAATSIHWENAAAEDYTLQVSEDGETWTDIASQTDQPEGERTDDLTFDPVTSQYLRVHVTAKAMSPYLSIYDITVPNLETAPAQFEGSVEPAAPDADTGTYLEPPVVTLTAAGSAGELSELDYAIDGDWQPVTGPFAVEGSGDVTVDYRATVGDREITGFAVFPLAADDGGDDDANGTDDAGGTDDADGTDESDGTSAAGGDDEAGGADDAGADDAGADDAGADDSGAAEAAAAAGASGSSEAGADGTDPGGQLPDTGSSSGLIAAIAAIAAMTLAAGAVLVRRRNVGA